MDIEHEKMIVSNFFNKKIQKRILYELTIPKKRRKKFWRLASSPDEVLDQRYIHSFELKNGKGPNDLLNMLIQHGASREKCYVMSDMSDLDGNMFLYKKLLTQWYTRECPLLYLALQGSLRILRVKKVMVRPQDIY
ncbi:hypothetical protein QS257_19880 [Terrilactibacillus sp. S3-3]|nr:hypothetical protein QS257_19880 [Terrilactibacillus sp. S3-3]